MTYSDIIRHFGGRGRNALALAAAKLECPKQTLHAWKRRGVPPGVQFRLWRRSGGKLPVSREHLRG